MKVIYSKKRYVAYQYILKDPKTLTEHVSICNELFELHGKSFFGIYDEAIRMSTMAKELVDHFAKCREKRITQMTPRDFDEDYDIANTFSRPTIPGHLVLEVLGKLKVFYATDNMVLCTICRDSKLKDYVITECKHKYHRKCLQECLNRGNSKCPTCRTNIIIQ